MNLTSLEGIKEILKNQNHFLTCNLLSYYHIIIISYHITIFLVVFNVWKFGDNMDQLKKFLMDIIAPVHEGQQNNCELV